MRFTYEVVIKSGDADVDMEYALKTFSGASTLVCLLAEAILRGRIVEKRTHANNFRAKLKHSFKGSYGQRFDIEINDKMLISKLNDIGKPIFSEVMTYYICEALYLESETPSPLAQTIIEDLVEIEDELTKRIRLPLKEMHKITHKNSYDVELNYRMKSGNGNIITLTPSTDALTSDAEISDVRHDISAIITRFNATMGNGRLIVQGREREGSVAFGFYDNLRYVTDTYTSKITQNLRLNNNLPPEKWTYLPISVNTLLIQNGSVIKYLIREVE